MHVDRAGEVYVSSATCRWRSWITGFDVAAGVLPARTAVATTAIGAAARVVGQEQPLQDELHHANSHLQRAVPDWGDPGAGSVFLPDGHDVACRIAEPSTKWPPARPGGFPGVGFTGIYVSIRTPAGDEFVDGSFDVVDHDRYVGWPRGATVDRGHRPRRRPGRFSHRRRVSRADLVHRETGDAPDIQSVVASYAYRPD